MTVLVLLWTIFLLVLIGKENEAPGPMLCGHPGLEKASWECTLAERQNRKELLRTFLSSLVLNRESISCFLPLSQACVFDLTLVAKQKHRKSSLETLACIQAENSADTLFCSSLIARHQR